MLIRFTLKNFGSFLNEQTLSLLKGKETQLTDHLNEDTSGNLKTLRGAIIYGANASGKSNLLEAIKYARDKVVFNNNEESSFQFLLDETAASCPSSFDFEFKIDNKAYAYGFEVLGKNIIREWLYEISSKKSDKMLFERHPKTTDTADIKFGSTISKMSGQAWQDLQAAARTTPDDTLFLHDAKRRNIKLFLTPLRWFESKLRVLSPDSVQPFSEQRQDFLVFLEDLLKAADVGIQRVDLVRESDLSKFNLPTSMLKEMDERLQEGGTGFVAGTMPQNRIRLLIQKEEGQLCAYRLVTVHRAKDGTEVRFELDRESDGTRRLIDIAPAFFSKDVPDSVLVADELDRSLHPLITEMLHNAHYSDKSRINGQLILATHEHYLLSQEFYRRDQIWFVEKDRQGISRLYSLTDYQVRHDKDIEKDYLLGRYGATPYIRNLNA